MSASLEGAIAKFERAKLHFESLQDATAKPSLLNAHSYRRETHDHGFKRVYITTRIDPVPPHIPVIFGDLIHNLRSCLDHIANQLVRLNNRNITDRSAFPIYWKRKRFDASLGTKLPGVGIGLKEVRSVQPYVRRKTRDPLWVLEKLDIADKHRELLLVVRWFRGATYSRHLGTLPASGSFPPSAESLTVYTHRLKVGKPFAEFRFPRNSDPQSYTEPNFSPGVAIYETPPAKNVDVIEVSRWLIAHIEGRVLPLFRPLF